MSIRELRFEFRAHVVPAPKPKPRPKAPPAKERGSALQDGESETARAFHLPRSNGPAQGAGHAVVNGSLPRRLCVNPRWLISARRIYFRPEFAAENAIFSAKARIFAKNGTR